MKKKTFKLLILMLIVALFVTGVAVVNAREPYASYYLGDNGAYPIPAPYEVLTVIDFKTTEEGRLANPEDIFIDDNDVIYVADTANDRIVIINPMDETGTYTLRNIIKGEGSFSSGDISRISRVSRDRDCVSL